MGAIKSLGCIWWINMRQIDTYPEEHRISACNIRLHLKKYPETYDQLSRNSSWTMNQPNIATSLIEREAMNRKIGLFLDKLELQWSF